MKKIPKIVAYILKLAIMLLINIFPGGILFLLSKLWDKGLADKVSFLFYILRAAPIVACVLHGIYFLVLIILLFKACDPDREEGLEFIIKPWGRLLSRFSVTDSVGENILTFYLMVINPIITLVFYIFCLK